LTQFSPSVRCENFPPYTACRLYLSVTGEIFRNGRFLPECSVKIYDAAAKAGIAPEVVFAIRRDRHDYERFLLASRELFWQQIQAVLTPEEIEFCRQLVAMQDTHVRAGPLPFSLRFGVCGGLAQDNSPWAILRVDVTVLADESSQAEKVCTLLSGLAPVYLDVSPSAVCGQICEKIGTDAVQTKMHPDHGRKALFMEFGWPIWGRTQEEISELQQKIYAVLEPFWAAYLNWSR
jgi:hypothetical protein